MVLLIAGAMAGAWLIVILWPGPAPLWLLVGLVAVLAVGGPGSMIGFDFARTYNPSTRLGTATGVVNIGGFVASLVAMYLVGLVLDILLRTGFSGGNLYDLAAFRIAMAVQFLVMGFGVVGILRNRRKLRSAMADDGLRLPPLREALARDRRRRREERSGTGKGPESQGTGASAAGDAGSGGASSAPPETGPETESSRGPADSGS